MKYVAQIAGYTTLALVVWSCQSGKHMPTHQSTMSDGGDAGVDAASTEVTISISADPIVLMAGGSVDVAADVRDPFGRPMPEAGVSWGVRDSTVATVADDGTLVGHQVGETTVFASVDGTSARAAVRVEEVDRVKIVPERREIGVGEAVELQAILYSRSGHRFGTAADFSEHAPLAHWQSASPDIASITQRGQLTGVGAGAVDIAVEAANTVATATFSVDVKFKSLTCGGAACCAISVNGRVYCWNPSNDQSGHELYGGLMQKVPGDQPFSSVAIGGQPASYCGLTATGRVFCWGRNYMGVVGQPDRLRDFDRPQPVDTQVRFDQVGLTDVAACGLSRHDKLYCWGRTPMVFNNTNGADPEFRRQPTLVSDRPFKKLRMGAYRMACVQAMDDTWSCMGQGANAQEFGDGSTSDLGLEPMDEPVPFSDMTTGATGSVMCGLGPRGRVYCRGYGGRGKLGRNPDDVMPHHFYDDWRQTAWDMQMHNLERPRTAGVLCSITKTHELVCWGGGNCIFRAGRLRPNTWRPHRIRGLPDDWVDFAALGAHGYVLTESGDIWTWGYQPNADEASDNAYVGPGERLCDPTPVRLPTY